MIEAASPIPLQREGAPLPPAFLAENKLDYSL